VPAAETCVESVNPALQKNAFSVVFAMMAQPKLWDRDRWMEETSLQICLIACEFLDHENY
jgi:hypothetical protein